DLELNTWIAHDSEGEKTGQGRVYDQRGGGALQAAPADVALVRARGLAEAVAIAREHAAVYGLRPGTAGRDLDAGARHGRESGGNRDHFEYEREDDRDGTADGRVCARGAAGVVAHGSDGRESAEDGDCESGAAGGTIEKW